MVVRLKLILIVLSFLVLPSVVGAVSVGDETVFNIQPSYDSQGRQEITALLVKITDQLYFYADKDWWQSLSQSEKQSLDVNFHNLGIGFERKIYPDLTKTFGSEPKPIIGDDRRVTVLLHPMISEAGGYFNSGDLYEKLQYPRSNQRNMVYLNSRHIAKPSAGYFLAHEFVHLITANQKDLLRNVVEETWLNEARAEYSATFLGYDDVYRGSNLERRASDFLRNPKVSLTEWLNRREDYGAVNLFTQYLVDHYGIKILIDSLQSGKAGIESINYALAKNNFKEDFSDVFSNWAIALLVNDCELGEKYCYLNKHLQDLRVTPIFYHLPKADTVMSARHETTYWGLNWHRFLGGGDEFILEFEGAELVELEVPYLLCSLNNNCYVEILVLDENQKGEIAISGFSEKYASLTIMPFINSKITSFNGREKTFSFSWNITVKRKTEEKKEIGFKLEELPPDKVLDSGLTVGQALSVLNLLRSFNVSQATLQTVEDILQGKTTAPPTEPKPDINAIPAEFQFEQDLKLGQTANEVRYLQIFLNSRPQARLAETGVGSPGQETNYFGPLTQAAVIRFQEKYASEILHPLNLQQGTGYVGEMTKTKINQLIR